MANQDVEIIRRDTDPGLKTILEGLQPGPIATEIKGMVEVACLCVAILEPWNKAKSKHPASKKIIKRVQEDFDKFFDTLVKSKDIARNGGKAMKDIAYLCSQLSNPTQPKEQLEVFVTQLSLPIGQADLQAKLIRTEFRQARIRVIEISNSMPGEVANIEHERDAEIADVEGLGKQVQAIQACTRWAVALGGITMTACPPAVILIPVAMDLVSLVEEAFRTRLVKKIEERELQIRRCEDALETLKKVGTFLSQLGECISKFIKFWLRIEEMVRGVNERIGDLVNVNLRGAWSIRLELAKNDWEEAALAYRDYVVMIDYLCMIVPPVMHSETPPSSGKKMMGLLASLK